MLVMGLVHLNFMVMALVLHYTMSKLILPNSDRADRLLSISPYIWTCLRSRLLAPFGRRFHRGPADAAGFDALG